MQFSLAVASFLFLDYRGALSSRLLLASLVRWVATGTCQYLATHAAHSPALCDFYAPILFLHGGLVLEMAQSAPKRLFTFKFTPKSIIPSFASRYLALRQSPIYPKIKFQCDNRDPNTLWWRVNSIQILGEKRVVRSRATRKVRDAFLYELNARGFDAKGRRLDSSIASTEGIRGNMRGTVTITILPSSLQGRFPEFRKEMKSKMDELIWQQRNQQSINAGKPKAAKTSAVQKSTYTHTPRPSTRPRKKGKEIA